jgi:hypothetical protein
VARWTYYAQRSSDGQPVAELPLADVSIEDVLSGRANMSGTLSLDDPMAARAYCAPWLREITAVRDGEIAFHGPIIGRRPNLQERTVAISAASPHAYFYKRVTEAVRHYNREQFSIVRALITDATAKTGGSLYRLTVSTGSSGVSKELLIGGSDRQRVALVIENLATDDVSGFDFRWDATWYDASQHLVSRKLTLGYPTIGRDLTASQVVQATIDLVDVQDAEDGLAAANRIHGLGATTKGTARLRSVSNSGSSLTAGYPLLEDVIDLSDVRTQALLDAMTVHARNARIPGVRSLTSTHTISPELPYGAVDLGDSVTVKLTAGVESINLERRVVSIRTVPATDQVTFVYYDPADAA